MVIAKFAVGAIMVRRRGDYEFVDMGLSSKRNVN
jgi:hypothetical protein